MNKRIAILLFLLLAVVVYRGTSLYFDFFNPNLQLRGFGIRIDVVKDHMAVVSLAEKESMEAPSTLYQAGVRKGDQILGIYNERGEGRAIQSRFDFGEAFKTIRYDQPFSLVVGRESSPGFIQEIKLAIPPLRPSALPLTAKLLHLLARIFVPMLILGTAFFIGFIKPEDDNAFLASLLFLSFSSIIGTDYYMFPRGLREFASLFNVTLNEFLFYLFMRFFLLFPSPSLIDRKAPWLKTIFLYFTIVFWLGGVVVTYEMNTSFSRYYRSTVMLGRLQWVPACGVTLMVLIGFASLILNTLKAGTNDEKRRMRILLAGTLIGLLPLILFLVYYSNDSGRPPPGWAIGILLLTVGAFPASFIYVIIKHRVLGIRVILRRGLQYALVSRGYVLVVVTITFVLLFLVSNLIFERFFPHSSSFVIVFYTALITIGVTAAINRINRPVIQAIDRRFFREACNAQQVLTDLSHAVRRLATQPERLLALVTDKISDSLFPDQVAIFLRGAELRALPAGRSRLAGEVSRLLPSGSDDYHCNWRRLRTDSQPETVIQIAKDDRLTLPEGSLIATELEKIGVREHQPLEVYLDDPDSWAGALIRVNSPDDPRYQEKVVIERLNTRLIVPLVSGERVLGFISLGERLSGEPYSREDKQLLLTVAEQTAIALDYARMIDQVAEQEKLNREIEIAKEVQQQLLPQFLPPMKSLEYSGICKPARRVGGDYYDFLVLGAHQLGIALADIAGKGISASLLMANLQALLRSQAPSRGDRVDELISEINRLMCNSMPGERYATFFYGLYDDSSQTLTYVNAGHNPPMVFRPNGSSIFHSSGHSDMPIPPALSRSHWGTCETIRLETGGTVVGMFTDSFYEKATLKMLHGDVLLLFTDGISEAMNLKDEEFGEERLARLVGAHLNLPVDELRDLILKEVDAFVGEAPQFDDCTLVVARVG
jgi:sigma-B regulation protein RsbU (phosphoserine phosphatase)